MAAGARQRPQCAASNRSRNRDAPCLSAPFEAGRPRALLRRCTPPRPSGQVYKKHAWRRAAWLLVSPDRPGSDSDSDSFVVQSSSLRFSASSLAGACTSPFFDILPSLSRAHISLPSPLTLADHALPVATGRPRRAGELRAGRQSHGVRQRLQRVADLQPGQHGGRHGRHGHVQLLAQEPQRGPGRLRIAMPAHGQRLLVRLHARQQQRHRQHAVHDDRQRVHAHLVLLHPGHALPVWHGRLHQRSVRSPLDAVACPD